jgi:hypothetical protein
MVSAPMRTCEVIETNRYTFRPDAERDIQLVVAGTQQRIGALRARGGFRC